MPILRRIPFSNLCYLVNFTNFFNHMLEICYLIFLFDSVTYLTYQSFLKEISHSCGYTHLSIRLLFCLHPTNPALESVYVTQRTLQEPFGSFCFVVSISFCLNGILFVRLVSLLVEAKEKNDLNIWKSV